MDLLLWKQKKKELKLTNQAISDTSGIPLRTVEAIFAGKTQFPRSDTVDAIEKALGLDKNFVPDISAEDKELIELIKQLDDEQTNELSNFVDYLLSKRK